MNISLITNMNRHFKTNAMNINAENSVLAKEAFKADMPDEPDSCVSVLSVFPEVPPPIKLI